MPKILIFGSTGLLGQSLTPYLRHFGCDVYEQSRKASAQIFLDPCDAIAVKDIFDRTQWDVVINLIAATNVDYCEDNPQYAYLANVRVVENLISAIEGSVARRPHLIHISTDQVYGHYGPHNESNVEPLNIYGLSKFTGELIAAKVDSTILRTNFFGRSHSPLKKSFSDWIVESLRAEAPITFFDDIYFNAVSLQSLCKMIERLISERPTGVFNFGSHGGVSKSQFAISLAKELDLSLRHVKIGSSKDLMLKAIRPKNMIMDVSKIEKALGLSCPSMDSEISQIAMEYLNV